MSGRFHSLWWRVAASCAGTWMILTFGTGCTPVMPLSESLSRFQGKPGFYSCPLPEPPPELPWRAALKRTMPERTLAERTLAEPSLPVLSAVRPGLLHLTSLNPSFGGWSGLTHDASGRLTAISDHGYWFQGHFEAGSHPEKSAGADRLVADAFGELPGGDGTPLYGALARDAEEVIAVPGGGFVVSFEQLHRLSYYPPEPGGKSFARPPLTLPFPGRGPGERRGVLGPNYGIEALTLLPDGRLLAIAEGLWGADRTTGWIGTVEGGWEPDKAPAVHWRAFDLVRSSGFAPTAVVADRCSNVFLLQRDFSFLYGFAGRISLLSLSSLEKASQDDDIVHEEAGTLLELSSADISENWEGMTFSPRSADELLLISDDNYLSVQRTLLLPVRGLSAFCSPAGSGAAGSSG